MSVIAQDSPVVGEAWKVTRRAARYAYHTARNLPDRLLHQRRHRSACERLLRANRPRAILVVCYGNVCRSPYLQAVLQRALPDVVVTSAGFVGSDRPVPEISRVISGERGLDLSLFRSRPLTPAAVNGGDLIIVMDSDQARQVAGRFGVDRKKIVVAADLDPAFSAARAILDPWSKSREVFQASFDRLDRCARTLIELLDAARPTAGSRQG
jgi:protein-tyrosine phosphatase